MDFPPPRSYGSTDPAHTGRLVRRKARKLGKL